jgi:hypothetical protein
MHRRGGLRCRIQEALRHIQTVSQTAILYGMYARNLLQIQYKSGHVSLLSDNLSSQGFVK